MKSKTKIPFNEAYYAELYREYHNDIAGFGIDLFGSDWDDWQLDVIKAFESDNKDELIIRASGHSSGKSYLSSIIAAHTLLFNPDVSIVATCSTQAQLLNKFGKTLVTSIQNSLISDYYECTTMKIYRRLFNGKPDQVGFIELCTNSESRVEAFAGAHSVFNLFIADEAAGLVPGIHQAILSSTAKNVPEARRRVLYFLNPLYASGPCYDIFYNKAIGEYWNKGHINSLDCKWADKEYCQMLIDSYGWDSDIVKVRVRGEFPTTSTSQLIPSDIIDESVNRPLQKQDYAMYPIIMAVDPARFGDDRSVIITRQGPYINEPIVINQNSITELARIVIDTFNQTFPRPSAIVVDAVGLGGGLYDILNDHLKGIAVEFVGSRRSSQPEQYFNLRTETFVKMKDAFIYEQLRLPSHPELLEELRDINYGYSPSMSLQIESKDTIKRRTGKSNDLADACCMLFYDFKREKRRRSLVREVPITRPVKF